MCRIIALVDIVSFVGRPTDSIKIEPESSSPSNQKIWVTIVDICLSRHQRAYPVADIHLEFSKPNYKGYLMLESY
jgi:hypothetical protein